jgi:hypothetical protein
MFDQSAVSDFKSLQDDFISQQKKYAKSTPAVKPFRPPKKIDTVVVEAQSEKTKRNQSVDKLNLLAEKISTPLLQITTIPYLKVFPITLTIDLKKVTIDETNFIKSHSIQTITYDSLREVTVETGIYSSSLRLGLNGQLQHPIILPHFRKKEAIKAKQILIGLINCTKAQIKPDDLDPTRDVEKIRTIGAAASPSQ